MSKGDIEFTTVEHADLPLHRLLFSSSIFYSSLFKFLSNRDVFKSAGLSHRESKKFLFVMEFEWLRCCPQNY